MPRPPTRRRPGPGSSRASAGELRPPAPRNSRGTRVGERVAARRLVRRRARQDALHRHLENLAAQGARHLGDLEDVVRDVPGGAQLADPALDVGVEFVVERLGREDHEQGHPSFGPGRGMSTTSASTIRRDPLDGAVDLAGPHPDALAVDGGVGAAIDDGGAARGDLDPVAVAPDPGVTLEVARPVARAVVVAPQEEGHRRHRLGDHELADLVDDRVAVLVERLDPGAERPALELAAVHRQQRDAADEGRADVGAAAGREEPGVAPDVLVDPLEALRRERRAGGADGAEAAQVAPRAGARRRPSCTRRCSWRSVPKHVMPARSARSQRTPMSGWPGLPS